MKYSNKLTYSIYDYKQFFIKSKLIFLLFWQITIYFPFMIKEYTLLRVLITFWSFIIKLLRICIRNWRKTSSISYHFDINFHCLSNYPKLCSSKSICINTLSYQYFQTFTFFDQVRICSLRIYYMQIVIWYKKQSYATIMMTKYTRKWSNEQLEWEKKHVCIIILYSKIYNEKENAIACEVKKVIKRTFVWNCRWWQFWARSGECAPNRMACSRGCCPLPGPGW